jgi:hypothetical protein
MQSSFPIQSSRLLSFPPQTAKLATGKGRKSVLASKGVQVQQVVEMTIGDRPDVSKLEQHYVNPGGTMVPYQGTGTVGTVPGIMHHK